MGGSARTEPAEARPCLTVPIRLTSCIAKTRKRPRENNRVARGQTNPDLPTVYCRKSARATFRHVLGPYGHFLMFGQTAVLGAVDGGGKGAIAVTMALAQITGRALLGERVWRSGPVAIVTYEDDQTEWLRRFAAACMHYEIDFADVYDNVHFIVRPELTDEGNERDGGIVFASVFEGRAIYPHGDEIIRILQQRLIRLLIVDPFNHAHGFDDGNNNVMIARVAKEMDRITRESGAAGLVLHHLRKGAIGDPDDLMGATSLRATFRSCRILARMTRDQSEKMNLTDYWRYIRVAGSKENYAPPPEKATWFKLIGIALGNATDTYPEGDNIGVATAWSLRPAFEGMGARHAAGRFCRATRNCSWVSTASETHAVGRQTAYGSRRKVRPRGRKNCCVMARRRRPYRREILPCRE